MDSILRRVVVQVSAPLARFAAAAGFKQGARADSQSRSDLVNVSERYVSFAALYLADVTPVQSGLQRQLFLRYFGNLSQLANALSECFPELWQLLFHRNPLRVLPSGSRAEYFKSTDSAYHCARNL